MGKYDSPENSTKEAKCLGGLLGQIHFRDLDFLSVELVEGTNVITGPECNNDWDNMRHVHNSLNMVILT